MTKLYNGKIPFQKIPRYESSYDGSVREAHIRQLDYESGRDIIWKDNIPFIAQIKIESYSRGRSAANWDASIHQVFCDADPEYASFLEGCHVNIFMVDMLHIIQNYDLFHGLTNSLNLVFSKRGMNYGMKVIESE
jgi:hypothetical protein